MKTPEENFNAILRLSEIISDLVKASTLNAEILDKLRERVESLDRKLLKVLKEQPGSFSKN